MAEKEIKESETRNYLTDEEMAEYKMLKEKNKKGKTEQTKKEEGKGKLLPIVLIGSFFYALLGFCIAVNFFEKQNYTITAVGFGLIIFALLQAGLVLLKKEKLPIAIKCFLYVVNAIPTLIVYVFSWFC